MRNFEKNIDMETTEKPRLQLIIEQMMRNKEIIREVGVERASKEYGLKFSIPKTLSHIPFKSREK
jgi:hypothetical protein